MSENTIVSSEKAVSRTAPFYADHVGSFLRSQAIKKARLQRENNEITAQQLREIENQEIIKIVEKQKEIGLSAVTDGEFRRAWWHFDFLENLIGVEGYTADFPLHFKDVNTKPRGIKVTGKIDFPENHPFVEDYKFLHSIAGNHIAKQTIPSPNMLFLRSSNEATIYDNNIEAYIKDLTNAYKKAIKTFYDAGCRYLQLDDTAWSTFFSEKGISDLRSRGYEPEDALQLFTRLINESIADRPSDLTITMHICRGNFRSSYFTSGGYDPVGEVIFGKLNVDGLFLEFDDERSGSFEPLKYVNRKDLRVVLGLLTSKKADLEDKEAIKQRIQEASAYIPLQQLRLSPQCGFASTEEGNNLSEEEQWEKLRHVVEISQEVWGV